MSAEGWLQGGRIYRELLEARWAAFFDALGLAWSYEVGGIEVGCGRWIPSGFWLPGVGRHVEVRDWPRQGVDPDFHPRHPAWDAAGEFVGDGPADRLVVIYGPPYYRGKPHPSRARRLPHRNGLGSDGRLPVHRLHLGRQPVLWTECPACGKIGIEYEGRAGRLCGRLHCPATRELDPASPT